MFHSRDMFHFDTGGGGGGGGGSTAPEEPLVYGMTCPVELDTWWEFRENYPVTLTFWVGGWGFNSGLSGYLNIGPVGDHMPIPFQMNDMSFVEQVNEGKLVQIASPQGS